ncbi:MAG: hypothetical protein EBS91_11290 [Betaproteobacteria bacterium]|nr:hypothetical protein [Betaproteobacteria bacterium]NCA25151.1 hypothetical protein [Betaproteobacteria bacterium]
MVPYTYLIGWKKFSKFYYGVRYAWNSHPSDLMKTYFSSSESVREMISENGIPDLIEIRKTFDSVDSARVWEHKVLRRMKVTADEKWLNKTDNKSISPMPGESNPMFGKVGELHPRFGSTHSDETKQVIGFKSSLKKGNMPDGFSEKMRQIVTGRIHKDESKLKIKVKLTGRTLSDSHIENIMKNHADFSGENNPFFGKSHSDESRSKMREKRQGKRWIHNLLQNKRMLVKESEINDFLSQGWSKGKGKWD